MFLIIDNRFLLYKLNWACSQGIAVTLSDNEMMGLTKLAFRGKVQMGP
jgi:hypothetical protein